MFIWITDPDARLKTSMDPGSGTLHVFLYLVVVVLDLDESRKTFCKHGNS
jgi:hypothetical protein